MKVNELIKRLQRENPNIDVVLSIDEEGNGFSSIELVESAKSLHGEIYGNDDDETPKNAEPVVVLWP